MLLLLACLFWPGSSLSAVASSVAEGWCFSISKQRVKKVSPCNFLGNWDALLMWSKAVIILVSLGSERVDECGGDGEEISLWATGGVNSRMLTYMWKGRAQRTLLLRKVAVCLACYFCKCFSVLKMFSCDTVGGEWQL